MHGRCRRYYGYISLRRRTRLTGWFIASNRRGSRRRYFPRARPRGARAGPPFRHPAPSDPKRCGGSPVAVRCGAGRRNGPLPPRRGSLRCGRIVRGAARGGARPSTARAAPTQARNGRRAASRRRRRCTGGIFLLQCRLHIHDRRGNYDRHARRSIGRARSRRIDAASRTARCTVVVRHAVRACPPYGEKESWQGTLLAQQSLRRSGMRNAGENDRWRKDR